MSECVYCTVAKINKCDAISKMLKYNTTRVSGGKNSVLFNKMPNRFEYHSDVCICGFLFIHRDFTKMHTMHIDFIVLTFLCQRIVVMQMDFSLSLSFTHSLCCPLLHHTSRYWRQTSHYQSWRMERYTKKNELTNKYIGIGFGPNWIDLVHSRAKPLRHGSNVIASSKMKI